MSTSAHVHVTKFGTRAQSFTLGLAGPMDSMQVVLLIFVSGKVVLTGGHGAQLCQEGGGGGLLLTSSGGADVDTAASVARMGGQWYS